MARSVVRWVASGAFEVAERILREILVPRREVVTLSASLSAPQALRELGGSGQTRAPVVGRSGLDDTLGVVHMRDLLDQDGPVAGYASAALHLPETLKVTEAIREMRAQRQQFALVVDEHGSIDGIVTMEDLVEEIVGEIYDETDRDVQAVVREADGSLLMPGGFPLHDLPDVGMDLDEDTLEAGDYTTVAGLVLAHLGHFPKGAGRGGRGAGPERRGGGGDRPGHHPGASASHVGARRRARAKLLIRPTASLPVPPHPGASSAGTHTTTLDSNRANALSYLPGGAASFPP